MKYPCFSFSMLVFSLSYMIWDYYNIGMMSLFIESDIVCKIILINILILGVIKGIKILSCCDLYKLFVTFLILFGIISLISIGIYIFDGMKKDISIIFCPLYLILFFFILFPVKLNNTKITYKYVFPIIFMLVISSFKFFYKNTTFVFDFLYFIFVWSFGFIYCICVLILFFLNLLSNPKKL